MGGENNGIQAFQIYDFCCISLQPLQNMSISLKRLSLEKAVTTKFHVNRMARRLEGEAYTNQIYNHSAKKITIFNKNSSLDPILSQINPFHALIPYLPKNKLFEKYY
jgi:hypothetical protein